MREMKNSGTEWLSDIPHDWTLSNIGSLYTMRNVKVSDRDYPPLSVTMKGVVPQLETAAKTDAHDDRKLVRKGDFAINSRSDRRGSCGIADRDGSVSLINTILAPRTKMNPDYYNWLFHSTSFADEFYRWGHGIVDDLWTTRWQEMKKIDVPVPSYEEQAQIASTLETECTKVDALIANQEAQIVKLKAYKQSLITEVVTKGLDPNVPMKDSGVKWIGEIPKHWNACKATRFIQNTQNGLTRRDLSESSGHIVLKLKNISADGEIDYSDINRINLTEKEIQTYSLIDGDFLFVRVNGSRALVGKCAIFNSRDSIVAYNDHIIRVRLLPLMNRYYYRYYLLSSCGKTEVELHTVTSAGQFTISGSGLRDVWTVLPPIDEQERIVDYLDAKCSQIDRLIVIKQEKIEKLNQYKKSLIYEYVTGKKEV